MNNPRRRWYDQGTRGRVLHAARAVGLDNVWRILMTAAVVWALVGQYNVLDDVQQGRRIAVSVTCATTTAVIDAGRATITGGAEALDPEFARNLEALGYPPTPVRKKQAEAAALLYAEAISRKVERLTGVDDVVRKDGSLDCKRLVELSRTETP